MAGIDPAAVPAFEDRMPGDQRPVFEDPHFGGMPLHLQHALAGGVRHGVEVSADGDHSVAADAALDGQDRVVGMRGQRNQIALLFGECVVDDPAGGGVDARIGDLAAPIVELRVEVVEAAEGPVEEEVLADVAERSLDLALGLRPVGSAGLGRRSVVVEQGDQGRVVDRRSVGVLSQDGGLHPVVEHLFRRPSAGVEGRHMASRHRLELLVGAEPPPQPSAASEDE